MPQVRLVATLAGLAIVCARSAFAQPPGFGDAHPMLPWDRSGEINAVALGDVDGDGDLDLLLGGGPFTSLAGSRLRLYLNGGEARFEDASSQVPSLPVLTSEIALGDLDADGDLDAFLVSVGQDQVLVNGGAGDFSFATGQVPPDSAWGLAAGLADLDGDGDLDAVVGNSPAQFGGPPTRLLLNDGVGAFLEATAQIPPSAEATIDVALGDEDADGDADLLLGKASSPTCRLLRNGGTGIFVDVSGLLPTGPWGACAPRFGDVDGDGDLDIVVGACGGCGLNFCPGEPDRLFLHGGTGAYADASSQLPSSNQPTTAAALSDFDGDGDPDILFGNVGSCSKTGCGTSLHTLFANDGSGLFSDASGQLPGVSSWAHSLVVGDVDADGDLDVVLGNRPVVGDLHPPCRLLLNDGSASFADATGTNPPTRERAAWALGDLDGDGDLDAAGQAFYFNDGTGTLSSVVSPPPLAGFSLFPTGVAVGDVDGDGDLDVLVAASNLFTPFGNFPGLDVLVRNDGGGVFFDASGQLPAVLDFSSAAALADLDGDGDPDILLANLGPERLYLNDGSGTFANASAQFPAVSDSSTSLALGDLDGDGDLDAVVGNLGPPSFPAGEPERLYLNDGQAVFSDASSQLPSPSDATSSLAAGDVDGDGDLDLLVGNAGLQNRLYRNDGSATFTDATTQFPVTLADTLAVGLLDAEGDGDLDALVCVADNPIRLVGNDGAGVFTAVPDPSAFVDVDSEALAIGDIDGDGDTDALIVDGGGPRVLTNLTRQLAWRGVPRIGKPLTFDLHGPVWGAWFLVASLGTGNTPLPPLGVMRLDLSTLIPQFGGLLDAQGRAAVTYQVPAIPALVGQSLYWQAVVVGPARLTNLERTTFTIF